MKNLIKPLRNQPIVANVYEYPKFFGAERKRIWAEAFEKAVAGYSLLADVT